MSVPPGAKGHCRKAHRQYQLWAFTKSRRLRTEHLRRAHGSAIGPCKEQIGARRPGSVPGQQAAAGEVPRGRGAARGRRPVQGLGAGDPARTAGRRS